MFTEKSIVGVIGSGAMGSGIAQVAATAGHKVFVYDTSKGALTKAEAGLGKSLQKLIEKAKLTEQSASQIRKSIVYTSDLSVFSECSLIIEAIIENLSIKQELFSQLEKIVSAECALASNTSSLSIASIAAACNRPSRVLGIHFFNPAPIMPLVEIIPAITTEKTIVDELRKLINGWGKTTVLTKDTPGFIVNRVARSFYGESIRIYEEGISDFSTIDWAMKEFGRFKMGPFELMDFIGNDINFKVTETVWEQFFYEPRFKPSLTQKRLYEARYFGRKSGKGYYDYSPGALIPEPQKDDKLGQYIFNRVLCMLINEAVDSYHLQLATREDLDLAMTKGVNYPKGLLKWADDIGLENVLKTLTNLYEEYGEDRYRPCVLMKRMAAAKQKFYS